jgi:pyruvate dehydrogenase E2 component (dihydrolipoamide acetyltransferase)
MESGSIASWLLKEGDKFEAGTAICEVETDKATVTYEGTDEGYLAKILVGSGEVKVGQPIMVTVEEEGDIGAFGDFKLDSVVAAPAPAPTPAPAAAPTPAPSPAPVAAPIAAAPVPSGGRVFASPFARKIARETGKDLGSIKGTGPNGRIVAEDVMAASATIPSPEAGAPAPAAAARVTLPPTGIDGVYTDFELSDIAMSVAARHTHAKQVVPHYYLSVDLNLTKLLALRATLNAGIKDEASGLSVVDFMVKASALAMKTVPDVNGSWMDTFVRRYDQVDVNVVMGSGEGLLTPCVKNAGGKGLKAISEVSR